MAHSTRTLLLNPATWDIRLTGTGKIAVCGGGEATAQNVANECRRFRNDTYFQHDRGIPYFAVSLGQNQNTAVVRSHLRKAALLVGDVAEVRDVIIDEIDAETRTLRGEITFTTKSGGTHDVGF